MSYANYPMNHPPFHRSILTGEFVRCLRKSNPNIQCFGLTSWSSEGNPASLFINDEQVGVIPKGTVPAINIKNSDGSLKHRCWWDVLILLASKGLVKIDEVIEAIKEL